MVILYLHLTHAGQALQLGPVDCLAEEEIDGADRLGAEVGDTFDGDESAVADDADPIGYPLDL